MSAALPPTAPTDVAQSATSQDGIGENPSSDGVDTEPRIDDLVEDVSIDGMCGVY